MIFYFYLKQVDVHDVVHFICDRINGHRKYVICSLKLFEQHRDGLC